MALGTSKRERHIKLANAIFVKGGPNMMRKACAASGLAAAAVASALMITSPAFAQSAAAARGVSGSDIRGSGNPSALLAGREFIPRDDGDDTTSIGGVGNVTGGSRNVGGIRNSRVSDSGNVEDYDYGD
ncbi:hypothetical protein GCM10023196_012650 [Actinoallomurus vinaceus]|uniref:Uncharacterized protein n=2 Tax=Actinoallomurus vinaceus TaxID=1080074 RepID=A0ABP8U547_9ACTN